MKPLGRRSAVERPSADVGEGDIDAMLESMRSQRPVFTAVERAAQETDRVTVDYTGRIGGEPFEGGDGKDVAIVIGSRQSRRSSKRALKGAAAGESRTVAVTFPAELSNKTLAGKTAELASPSRRSRSSRCRPSTRNSAAASVSKRAESKRCGRRCAKAWSGSSRM